LPLLTELLKGEVADQRPFEFGVGGLNAFPDLRRPRVIWVGVKGPKELNDLHHAVESAVEKLGTPVNRAPFEPT
jgi:2''-5'' RNA ligase